MAYGTGFEVAGRLSTLDEFTASVVPLADAADGVLKLAYYSGLGAITLSVLLLLAVVGMRLHARYAERHHERVLNTWRPVMASWVAGEPGAIPTLRERDLVAFLELWNHYQESVTGDARGRLAALAIGCGISGMLGRLMRRGSLDEELLAIRTIGHMREFSFRGQLRQLLEDASPVRSLAAAGALLRIDPGFTLPLLMDLGSLRQDWPVPRLVSMLEQCNPESVTAALLEALRRAAHADDGAVRLPRLLKFTKAAYAEQVTPVARSFLGSVKEPRVVAEVLNLLGAAEDLAVVLAYAYHPVWFVRVAAAKALGRLGGEAERECLIDLMRDPSWWVRYRAAKAYAQLPQMTREKLTALRALLNDRYAEQMLDQILAEAA